MKGKILVILKKEKNSLPKNEIDIFDECKYG
jgi:hypothetical protein